MFRKQIADECRKLNFRFVEVKEPTLKVLNFLRKLKNEKTEVEKIKVNSQKDEANFIFFLNSLDFNLWIHPRNWRYKNKEGFFALQERLLDSHKNFGFRKTSFSAFRKFISPQESKTLARQRYNIYLLSLNWLGKNFDGDIRRFLNIHQNNLGDFVEKLSELPQYQDFYPKYKIHFFKKAQLLYWDFYLHKFIKQRPRLVDLTVFPDYLMPAFWRALGILSYGPALRGKINDRKRIKSGSRMEIEIRAGTVLAGEMLAEKLGILPAELDLYSWLFARNLKLNFHRTKTLFY